jgi:uncharacterized protein DUF5670
VVQPADLSLTLFIAEWPTSGVQLSSELVGQGRWWKPVVEGESAVLWTLIVILLVLWLLGWGLQVAGSLIHLLLLAAVVVLLANLLIGRRAT